MEHGVDKLKRITSFKHARPPMANKFEGTFKINQGKIKITVIIIIFIFNILRQNVTSQFIW